MVDPKLLEDLQKQMNTLNIEQETISQEIKDLASMLINGKYNVTELSQAYKTVGFTNETLSSFVSDLGKLKSVSGEVNKYGKINQPIDVKILSGIIKDALENVSESEVKKINNSNPPTKNDEPYMIRKTYSPFYDKDGKIVRGGQTVSLVNSDLKGIKYIDPEDKTTKTLGYKNNPISYSSSATAYEGLTQQATELAEKRKILRKSGIEDTDIKIKNINTKIADITNTLNKIATTWERAYTNTNDTDLKDTVFAPKATYDQGDKFYGSLSSRLAAKFTPIDTSEEYETIQRTKSKENHYDNVEEDLRKKNQKALNHQREQYNAAMKTFEGLIKGQGKSYGLNYEESFTSLKQITDGIISGEIDIDRGKEILQILDDQYRDSLGLLKTKEKTISIESMGGNDIGFSGGKWHSTGFKDSDNFDPNDYEMQQRMAEEAGEITEAAVDSIADNTNQMIYSSFRDAALSAIELRRTELKQKAKEEVRDFYNREPTKKELEKDYKKIDREVNRVGNMAENALSHKDRDFTSIQEQVDADANTLSNIFTFRDAYDAFITPQLEHSLKNGISEEDFYKKNPISEETALKLKDSDTLQSIMKKGIVSGRKLPEILENFFKVSNNSDIERIRETWRAIQSQTEDSLMTITDKDGNINQEVIKSPYNRFLELFENQITRGIPSLNPINEEYINNHKYLISKEEYAKTSPATRRQLARLREESFGERENWYSEEKTPINVDRLKFESEQEYKKALSEKIKKENEQREKFRKEIKEKEEMALKKREEEIKEASSDNQVVIGTPVTTDPAETPKTSKSKKKRTSSTKKSKTKTESVLPTDNENDIISTIENENKEFTEGTNAVQKHTAVIQEEAVAEQNKINISETLSKMLQEERKAFGDVSSVEQSTNAVEENTAAIKENSEAKKENAESFGVKLGKLNISKSKNFENDHTYYDEAGNRVMSITQLRDVLLGQSDPKSKEDIAHIKNVASALGENETLTPEMVGMTNEGLFNYYKNIIGAGLKGNIFHDIVDGIYKYNTDHQNNMITSLEELKGRDDETYERLTESFVKTKAELAKYGFGEDYLTTHSDIAALMESLQKMGAKPIGFSEKALGFTLSGPQGTFKVASTPDQLYSGEFGPINVDNKTGRVKGIEGFQLTGEMLAMRANKDISELKDLDLDKMQSRIADVKNGYAQLYKYSELPIEDFYNLLVRSQKILNRTASPLDENEKKNLNTQRATDIVTGGIKQEYVNPAEQNTLMSQAVKNQKAKYQVTEQIDLLTKKANDPSRLKTETQSYLEQIKLLQQKLALLEKTQFVLNQEGNLVKLVNGEEVKNISLNEQQQIQLKEQLALLENQHKTIMAKNAGYTNKNQRGFFGAVFGQIKQTFEYLTRTSIVYGIIGKIQSTFSTLIQTVQSLDKAMVDLQIATNTTRSELQEATKDYNSIATEMGRTTQEVMTAANDWLRAGYKTKEANELIRDSMKLSTLGMIDSAKATEYLISTMKGWKLQAEEVSGVVDDLTALDMEFATSAGDIAQAMAKANVSASLAGVDRKTYESMLTAVMDVGQQGADVVGTA